MIKRFAVRNYKALRDVTLDLTPIHLLIGPNDSGKTSILEAMAALCRSVDTPLSKAFPGYRSGASLVWQADPSLAVELEATADGPEREFTYHLSCRFSGGGTKISAKHEELRFADRSMSITSRSPSEDRSALSEPRSARVRSLTAAPLPDGEESRVAEANNALKGIHFYHWYPQHLALPVAPDARRRYRMDTSGFGLALCLDHILGYDRDLFMRLENRYRAIFKQVKPIMLKPGPAYRSPPDVDMQEFEQAEGKGIYFRFEGGGPEISARQVSDGMLLVLAYVTLLHLPEPPRLLLIEEPENGVHPKRLREVLTILRELIEEQKHTQVVLTTHSPYVVDLFKPEEVTLCQREEDGSVSVHRLSESSLVREQAKVFTLGEIWTAEGDERLAGTGVAPQSSAP